MEQARILVLDDDPSTLAGVRLALASAHDVTTEAEGHADVVVLPLSPEGLATMERLKDSQGAAAFVITYAPGQEGEIAHTLRQGAFYCLARPVDAQVLRAVVARCLELTALRQKAHVQAERLGRELAEAQHLQRAMSPAAEGRLGKSGVTVTVRRRPCAEVGGDVVDYAEADGRAALLIADVAGHGIGAAMLTTLIKSAFASSASAAYDPSVVATAIENALRPFAAERFVTLIAARIDRSRKNIEYINAGHPAGWVFHRSQIVQELKSTGPLVMPGTTSSDWKAGSLPFPDNSGLLLFTDGVTDAKGEHGPDRFGAARLRDEVERFPGGGAALLDGIIASLDAFTARQPQQDDLTLLTASVGLPGLA